MEPHNQQSPQQQQQQQQHHHHHHQQQHWANQHSRPPSVDSVNLGSVYSGFYPQALSTGPTSLGSNIPSATTNAYHSYYPAQHQQYNNYASTSNNGSMVGVQSGYLPNFHPQTPIQAGGSRQPQSLPPDVNYLSQVSAQAAASAAFGCMYSQTQQQSGLPATTIVQSSIANPNVTTSSSVGYPGLTPPSMVQWPSSQFAPYGVQTAMTNHNPLTAMFPETNQPSAMANRDFILKYYAQYYSEYYQKIAAHNKIQQQLQNQKKIVPFKYNRFHTPITFSQNDNQLLMVEPNYRIGLYCLQEVFTEQLYPQLFLQTLLYDNQESSTLLPFENFQSAIDWIRVKQLNDSGMNYELKLILKVITMLFRQNGSVSGLDLSELLFELISGAANDDSEKLSQSGSTKDFYRESISHLRQLLMRGQRRVAIAFAQTNGLFDHALSLSYLFSFLSPTGAQINLGQLIDNGSMISTIRKFINTCFAPEDPLYVFYSHLLQIATNVIHANTSLDASGPNSPASSNINPTSSAKIDRLESFIILLANEIRFDKFEIADKSYKNLIDLMIALLKDDDDYVLPDEIFNNDRFDCLLVNECLELARFQGKKMNPKLLLRKLEFAFELFDFGFVRHAQNYLIKIKKAILDDSLDWKTVVDKKSKFCKFFLPESALSDDEDVNVKLLQSIWLYHMAKIFSKSRTFSLENEFDSPLFVANVDEPSVKTNDEHDQDVVDNEEDDANLDDEEEATEDKTDVVEDLEEEEEADVELETSESSMSNAKAQQSARKASSVSLSQSKSETGPSLQSSHTLQKPPSEKSISELLPQSKSEENQSFPENGNDDSQQNSTLLNSAPSNPPQTTPVVDKFSLLSSGLSPIGSLTINSLDDSAANQPSQESIVPSFNSSMNHSNHNPSFSMPSQPTLFQPPPITTTESSSTFDFVSSNGRVQSIPSYDPISLNDDIGNSQNAQQSDPSIASFTHKNNEFLQNYPVSSSAPNNNKTNETDRHSNGESAKSSPNKTNNNGGLFNALFGRLKPKNQMILPDDKDPQIIFDPVTKRWIDKSSSDKSGLDGYGGIPPPPKMPLGSIGSGTAAGVRSEPNSSLTSPIAHHNPPTMPSLPIYDSLSAKVKNILSDNNVQAPNMVNGGLSSSSTSPTSPLNPFGGIIPPTVSGTNAAAPSNVYRNDIRRKRYIDVFNPATAKQ